MGFMEVCILGTRQKRQHSFNPQKSAISGGDVLILEPLLGARTLGADLSEATAAFGPGEIQVGRRARNLSN